LHPPRERAEYPDSLPPALPVTLLTTDDVTLRGWYVPSGNRAAVVLGNGHGAARGQLAFEARALTQHGYGVLLFDWRAHGESGGSRTTWGVEEQRDLKAAVDYVARRPDVDPQKIGALGFSMGAMTVTMVAARDVRLRAVALEGGFTSLEAMIRHDESHFGWLSERAAVATLRDADIDVDAVRPIDVICRISPRPVLIINGADDRDTPVAAARELFAAACRPKSLVIIAGANHQSYAAGGAALAARIVAFFDQALDEGAIASSARVATATLARRKK